MREESPNIGIGIPNIDNAKLTVREAKVKIGNSIVYRNHQMFK